MTLARPTSVLAAFLGVITTATLVPLDSAYASHGCRSSTSSDAKILDRTKYGVVFFKRSGYHGCLYSVGSVRRLPRVDGYRPTGSPAMQLGGRYVAYVAQRSAGTEPTKHRVVVFDLRRNEVKVNADSHSHDGVGGELVWSLVVKRNGSVAWISTGGFGFRGESPIRTEVHKIGHDEGSGDVLLDAGDKRISGTQPSDIDLRSLAISADHLTIYWRRDGQPKNAPLR